MQHAFLKTIRSSDELNLQGVLFYDISETLQGNYEDTACQSSDKIVDDIFHPFTTTMQLVIDFDILEDMNNELIANLKHVEIDNA